MVKQCALEPHLDLLGPGHDLRSNHFQYRTLQPNLVRTQAGLAFLERLCQQGLGSPLIFRLDNQEGLPFTQPF